MRNLLKTLIILTLFSLSAQPTTAQTSATVGTPNASSRFVVFEGFYNPL